MGGNFFVERAMNGRVQEENLKVQGAVYVQQCKVRFTCSSDCKHVVDSDVMWAVCRKPLLICFGVVCCGCHTHGIER